MSSFASNTDVSPEKSRVEIERLLFKFGATEFGVVTKLDCGAVTFVMGGIRIMIQIPLPLRSSFRSHTTPTGRIKKRSDDAVVREHEQAVRSRWRSLCLLLKAKLVGIQEGATSFEVEFMPYMVTSTGETVGERMKPMIDAARNGNGQLLLTAQ